MTRRTTTSRAGTERERSSQLSEEEILTTALRLARRVGLDQLTMRQLADDLGVTPMAAYYYVPNKDALLELVANSVIDSVDLPQGMPWDDYLREMAERFVAAVSTCPGLGAYLVSHPTTRAAYRITEVTLSVLSAAGFDERSAILAHSAVYTYLLGRLGLEAKLRGRPRHFVGSRPVRSDYATMESLGDAFAQLRSKDYLDFGLEAIIAGLRAKLAEQLRRSG